MIWLYPLYLAGAGAIIAPILLHLRRRPPQRRVEFSSLMFLEQTPLVTTTRSRIERWLLLLLRCLALLLMAAMFARPFMQSQETQAGTGRAVAVLLDRSASMQHSDQWAKAVTKAREVLGTLKPTDQVMMATFDQQLQRVATVEQCKDRSAGERGGLLANLKCGWQGTDLGRALIDTVGALNEVPGVAQKQIIVISDAQDGASVEALRGFAWPDQVSVRIETITPTSTNNLALSLVVGEPATEDNAKPSDTLRVRLVNARDASNDAFALRWDEEKETVLEGHLSAGASRVVRLPRPQDGREHVLHLAGDDRSFDNDLYLAPSQPREANIVAIAGEEDAGSVASPLFYLQRAMQPTSKLAPKIKVIGGKDASWPVLVDLAVCTSTSDGKQATALKAWVEQGHLAICTATTSTTTFLDALLGQTVKLNEANVKDYALLSEIDFAHPVLKPFEDVRLHDFTKIHFWHHRVLEAPALKSEVIARFDDGSPAWLSITMGKGRLVLMLSGWQPRDSQLALSSKFVPLLFGFLQQAGVSMDQPTQFVMGDALPDGKADKPGFVKTTSGRLLAVNLPPEESRIAPMDVTKLTSLGVKLAFVEAPSLSSVERQRLANEELESRQQYWLLALAVLLIVLLLETWIAGRKPADRALPTASTVVS